MSAAKSKRTLASKESHQAVNDDNLIEILDDDEDDEDDADDADDVDVDADVDVDVEDDEQTKKISQRRRLKLLLDPSVTPSFIAIISPNYQDYLPKRIRVNVNERLGLTRKKPRLTIRLGPIPSDVASNIPKATLPQEEGYFEGLVPMGLADDALYLTELHVMIRSQLELFSATDDDVAMSQAGRRTPTVRGKVGVRCIHCANVVLNQPVATRVWPPASVSYPVNIEGLYSVCTQKVQLHFESCPNMSAELKAQLYRLSYDTQGNSVRRQKLNNVGHSSMSAANYYLISAKRIGMINVAGGIRFGRDLSLPPLALDAVRAEVEAQSNAGKRVYNAGQLKSTLAEIPTPRIPADHESERVLAAAIAEEDSDDIIGRSDDKKLVTDFVFLCVRQMAYCHAVPADFETRGKKTTLMRLGFAGFCCRHCKEVNNPETSTMTVDYSCRCFTSAPDNMSSAIMNAFHQHLRNCYLVPMEIRKALAAYKKIHSKQIPRFPIGSQRRLFHAIWNRLRVRDIDEEEMRSRLKFFKQPAPTPETTLQPVLEAPPVKTSEASVQDTSEQGSLPAIITDPVDSGCVNNIVHSICYPQCEDAETVALLRAVEENQDYATNGSLILATDRVLVTDYVFFMMRHMKVAIPNASDCFRGKRSANWTAKLAGFACMFCHGQDSTLSASGRTFPSAPDNMASSLNTSLYNHMLRCFYVPENVKRAVTNLKRIHSQQCSNLKFGSQRKFFNLVYSRLLAVQVPKDSIIDQAQVKAEENGLSVVQEDQLLRFGFIRISSSVVECSQCRLVPLSLRAPNAFSTDPFKTDVLSDHRDKCMGREFFLGWVVGAISKIMDSDSSVSIQTLGLNSFKAILHEFLVDRSAVDRLHSSLLVLLCQARGISFDSIGLGDMDANAVGPSARQLNLDVDYQKVARLFDTWAGEIGIDQGLKKNPSFFHLFQLLSPALVEPS